MRIRFRIGKLIAALCMGAMVLGIQPASSPAEEAAPAPAAPLLTIAEAVRIALEKNLDLRITKVDGQTAGTAIESEEGAFDAETRADASVSGTRSPSNTRLIPAAVLSQNDLDFNAFLARTIKTGTRMELSWKNGMTDTNSPIAALDPSYSSSVGLTLTHPLMQGSGEEIQAKGIEAAKRQAEAATVLIDDKAAELAAEVRKAYYELVFTLQDLEVKKLSLKLAETLLAEMSEKIKAGVNAPVEIHQPEAEVARREELLLQAQRRIGSAEDSLRFLLNTEDWSGPFRPSGEIGEMGEQSPSLAGVIDTALKNRADLKAAEARTAAARLLAERADDARRPSLNLVGGVGMSGIGENYYGAINDLVDESFYNWNVGVAFRMPLENRVASANHARARYEVEKAGLQNELLKQAVTRAAREAVRGVEVAIKSIDASKKTSIASKKRMEAEEARFQVGLSTANDVLEAQEGYAQALAGEKRAIINYRQALADLDRVEGVVRLGQ